MSRKDSLSDFDNHSFTSDSDEEDGFEPASESAPPAQARNASHSSLVRTPGPPEVIPQVKEVTSDSEPLATAQPKQPPFTGIYSTPSSVPVRKATTSSTNGKPSRPNVPLDRFRTSVRKVIHLTRGSSMMSLGGAGAEPGIDPRRYSANMDYGHVREKCAIDIIDYSSLRFFSKSMSNQEFVEFMDNEVSSPREPWVKVRWINIGGLSWDVMSAVALAYNLHPLAIEDVLHQRQKARSKADYYPQHLFIRLLRHTVAPDNEETLLHDLEHSVTPLPRSASPDNLDDGKDQHDEHDEDKTLVGRNSPKEKSTGSQSNSQGRDLERGEGKRRPLLNASTLLRRKHIADAQLIQQLRKGERVNVDVQPLCLFLLRDGTVISISKKTDLSFTAPIVSRLRQRDTSLRSTADASLLIQSLLDLVVDQAMEVVDDYQQKIIGLEHDILIKPNVKTVRYLHTMSGDLTLRKRTLAPIKTLIFGLRRYDADRSAALFESDIEGSAPKRVGGFMSHKAKIYLADVYDHIDYIISSLEMFETTTENLINYTFNMASYEMNDVMRRLTLATIIFLPLTLLTGYFGMNFNSQWSTQDHSDLFFWEIALPVMAVLIPIFMWGDIRQAAHYLKKRWLDRKLRKILQDDLAAN